MSTRESREAKGLRDANQLIMPAPPYKIAVYFTHVE